MPHIDPIARAWVGVLVTVLTGIGSGAVSLTNVFPPKWTPYVIGWSLFLSFIGNVILTTFNFMGSTTDSRLASATAVPGVKGIVADRALANSIPNEKVISTPEATAAVEAAMKV